MCTGSCRAWEAATPEMHQMQGNVAHQKDFLNLKVSDDRKAPTGGCAQLGKGCVSFKIKRGFHPCDHSRTMKTTSCCPADSARARAAARRAPLKPQTLHGTRSTPPAKQRPTKLQPSHGCASALSSHVVLLVGCTASISALQHKLVRTQPACARHLLALSRRSTVLITGGLGRASRAT